MFHPGRFNLKSVRSNNVLCTTVMYSNTFTQCVAAVSDSMLTLFKLSNKMPNHKAADYTMKIKKL